MRPTVALLDACILYSAALRDLLMWLAIEKLYLPRWTEQIHDEWMENVLANRPDLSRAKLERTRALMNVHAANSLVKGYEDWISNLILPDMKDRHVLAAAIVAEASVIVTYNLTDFPASALAPYEVEAQHPDVFISRLLISEPERFLTILRELLAELQSPPQIIDDYLHTLRNNRLVATVARLETYRTQF